MGLAVASTASACRRLVSLLVPEVPGRLGAAGGRVGGLRWRRGRLAERRRLGRGGDASAGAAPVFGLFCGGREAGFLADAASCCAQKVLAEPPVPAGGASGAPVRPEGAGDGFGDAPDLGWKGFGGTRSVAGLACWKPARLLSGASWFFCVGDGEGPVAGSFPMVMRSSPEGALVSDRRPGPGSGFRVPVDEADSGRWRSRSRSSRRSRYGATRASRWIERSALFQAATPWRSAMRSSRASSSWMIGRWSSTRRTKADGIAGRSISTKAISGVA